MTAIIKDPTRKEYGDLAGRYPTMSSSGNKYILVIYYYDLNAIIVEPLKSCQKGDILNGYRNLHKQLSSNEFKPQIRTFYNEASDILLEYMRKIKFMYNWRHRICIIEI